MRRKPISKCFERQVIPVVWEPGPDRELLAAASAVFLQGGPLAELGRVLEAFDVPPLDNVSLFVHIDLVSGLENNEAGLEFLAGFDRLAGVVSIHHHLTVPARRLGLLSIVRLFLSDSRAVERGVSVATKSKPDAIEILPAAGRVVPDGRGRTRGAQQWLPSRDEHAAGAMAAESGLRSCRKHALRWMLRDVPPARAIVTLTAAGDGWRTTS